MSKVQLLRGFINQRLTAAAEEIFGLFERTISEYEEELCRSKEENQRHRKLLDAVFQPEVRLHRAGFQQLLVSKEEVPPEQQLQPWSPRLDQEDPPETPHITKTDGEDSAGTEPGRNFNSDSPVQPATHDQTSLSSDRENKDSCDWEENWQKHKATQTVVKAFSCSVLVSKEEVPPEQQQQWSPRLDQEDPPETPHNKEDQEKLGGKQLPGVEEAETPKFPFTPVPVKSEEDDEEKPQSSQLHQSQTEQMETEAKGEGCGGPEPARNFNPDSPLQPATHDQTSPSSEPETEDISDWEENLEEHLPKRSGIQTAPKAFSCSVCKKTFQWRADAVRHMRVHTGEKPFSCSVCGNRFARKDRLRQHLTVHTGERPFGCNVCGKRFTRPYTVKKHKCVG